MLEMKMGEPMRSSFWRRQLEVERKALHDITTGLQFISWDLNLQIVWSGLFEINAALPQRREWQTLQEQVRKKLAPRISTNTDVTFGG
tara:strand:+ start:312 stop:575 length:264 start_codon:yes stop_codon:yes gene_type:complete